ncbi:MAG: hypothetical protein COW30_04455 [Rhodospirillales bacterium CG15_BIG_FIL_POST_REV_8_21_14_020_66_15]|nr:MAG: hypothetical protein COW30_04455 [Rhodospirillales bacterium CG15_BIG_FIL_POST_REV_8_21_14_020_66_15]
MSEAAKLTTLEKKLSGGLTELEAEARRLAKMPPPMRQKAVKNLREAVDAGEDSIAHLRSLQNHLYALHGIRITIDD